MANIYDDVELLQQQVTALQTAVAGMTVQTLTEGADIRALPIGNYVIPNATICATLLNKPTSRTATGYVSVISCGDAGQKLINYVICDKTTFVSYQCAYYADSWGDWTEINSTDSGWIDLPLATGITAYSDAQKPRYRKIGKTIFLTGVYKGAVGENVTIATLPSGYIPQKKVILPTASVGQMFSKISVETSGEIVLNRTTVEPIIAENWHSIACCFEIN